MAGPFSPCDCCTFSHTLTPVLLTWVSPAANRSLQILFPKNVLTRNALEIMTSAGVKIGQEADRNGSEGNVSAQRRTPSLHKPKTQNTRLNKGKFSHCGSKHFIGPICCIEYSRDFGIEPIYQIASSLLFVRSLGTINEGD